MGCTNTVRESALKAGSGREIHCSTRAEKSVSSSSMQDLTLHQLSYPPPPNHPPQNVVQQVGGNKEAGGRQRFNTKKFNSLEMS